MSNPQSTPAIAPAASTPAPPAAQEPVPSAMALLTASKLAIKKDKPIMLDYFVDSISGKAFLGEDTETKERMLVKSMEEFTSQIDKVYKAGPPGQEEYIIETENSIYIASSKIQRRRIQASSLLRSYKDE
jgi:hypothetical protein